ncbi:hypothetical protein [Kordia sp.]|uniref:hypothetical protein n=1 Tax=Kordia sp. TaxID=1965332 RepID=UPI003B598454
MKKRNLKSLSLNKKSISSLDDAVRAHGGGVGEEGSSYFSCIGGICSPPETEITCPTWVLCDWTKVAGGCSFQ